MTDPRRRRPREPTGQLRATVRSATADRPDDHPRPTTPAPAGAVPTARASGGTPTTH
ncbi:hypothetical protein ACQSSU_11865 [Micromonospora echinospora]